MLLLLDQSGTGSKSARDIAEMRLIQVVQQAVDKARGLVVISCEKEDLMQNVTVVKHKVNMRAPDRSERKQIVDHCLAQLDINGVDSTEIAKLLQGKSFRDIQRLLSKVTKSLPRNAKMEQTLTASII